jgi:amino acid transporter
MRDRSAATIVGTAPAPPTKLQPDAIGVAQDTVIGLATSAPGASIALTLAPLVAATAYGTGPVILLTAVPMLVIANAYRRLNMWNANCGASFEWVGRAINPYLGFLTGWLMIAAYVIATVSGVEVLGPSVLAIFGSNSNSTWANIAISTAVAVLMLVIAVVGIRITARTQVGMAFIEYAILVGFAAFALVSVLNHHPGTFSITKGWFSLTGINGKGSPTAGFLTAVFMFTGWDGTLYVNEEVKHRSRNPGRAAITATIILAFIYTFCTFGLQGAASPDKLQNNSADVLVFIGQSLGGSGWAKMMALGLALSVIGSTGAGIVVTSRIVYGMASYRVLPDVFANVSRRFATPVPANILIGGLVIGLTWVYLLATSVQNAFNDVVAVAGLLFCIFYILTALATIVYYRRRLSDPRDLLILGILPIAAAGFLGWVVVKSLATGPSSNIWSVVGVAASGILLMIFARVFLRPQFFHLPREMDTATKRHARR